MDDMICTQYAHLCLDALFIAAIAAAGTASVAVVASQRRNRSTTMTRLLVSLIHLRSIGASREKQK